MVSLNGRNGGFYFGDWSDEKTDEKTPGREGRVHGGLQLGKGPGAGRALT